jgi:hypothetical protein
MSRDVYTRRILEVVQSLAGRTVTAERIADMVGCSRRTVINLLAGMAGVTGIPGVGYRIAPDIRVAPIVRKQKKQTPASSFFPSGILDIDEENKGESEGKMEEERENNSISLGFTIWVDGETKGLTRNLRSFRHTLPRISPSNLSSMVWYLDLYFQVDWEVAYACERRGLAVDMAPARGRLFRRHEGAVRWVLRRGVRLSRVLLSCAIADFYASRRKDYRIRRPAAWLHRVSTVSLARLSLSPKFRQFFAQWFKEQIRELKQYIQRLREILHRMRMVCPDEEIPRPKRELPAGCYQLPLSFSLSRAPT